MIDGLVRICLFRCHNPCGRLSSRHLGFHLSNLSHPAEWNVASSNFSIRHVLGQSGLFWVAFGEMLSLLNRVVDSFKKEYITKRKCLRWSASGINKFRIRGAIQKFVSFSKVWERCNCGLELHAQRLCDLFPYSPSTYYIHHTTSPPAGFPIIKISNIPFLITFSTNHFIFRVLKGLLFIWIIQTSNTNQVMDRFSSYHKTRRIQQRTAIANVREENGDIPLLRI